MDKLKETTVMMAMSKTECALDFSDSSEVAIKLYIVGKVMLGLLY